MEITSLPEHFDAFKNIHFVKLDYDNFFATSPLSSIWNTAKSKGYYRDQELVNKHFLISPIPTLALTSVYN